MTFPLLLTGATGAVGAPLLAEILRSDPTRRVVVTLRNASGRSAAELRAYLAGEGLDGRRVEFHSADLADPRCDLRALPAPEVIVHAAASTQFRAPFAELASINLGGTERLLGWAESLPHRPRLVHVSTLCVAGRQTGPVPETPFLTPPPFVNAYEHTKWLAEGRVLASPLATEIVRLGIVAGREADGATHRIGALHTTLRWLRRGLLPLIPGDRGSRVELISTDLVARFVARLIRQPATPRAIYHLSASPDSLKLSELIDLAADLFSRHDAAWRDQQILPPVIASPAAFELFRASVIKSRDLRFNQIIASADAFLPTLLYPKIFATTQAERAWGGPLPWPPARVFAETVINASLARDAAPAIPSAEEAA